MSSELSVREATQDDFMQLLEFTLALAKIIGVPVNQAVLKRGMQKFFPGPSSYGKYFMFLCDDKPIGQVVIKPVLFESWQNSHIIWIDDFHVASPFDTHEHMPELLQRCIDLAVEKQPQEIVKLYCPHAHAGMLQALSRLGFEAEGYFLQQSQDYILKPSRRFKGRIREATTLDQKIVEAFTMNLASSLTCHLNCGVVQDGVGQLLQNPKYGKCFLALQEENIIGQLVIKKTLFEPWYDSFVVWVDDTFVHRDYQNTGAMKSLLYHALELEGQDQWARIVQLYCPFKNSQGVAFWTSVGFVPIGWMMERKQTVHYPRMV